MTTQHRAPHAVDETTRLTRGFYGTDTQPEIYRRYATGPDSTPRGPPTSRHPHRLVDWLTDRYTLDPRVNPPLLDRSRCPPRKDSPPYAPPGSTLTNVRTRQHPHALAPRLRRHPRPPRRLDRPHRVPPRRPPRDAASAARLTRKARPRYQQAL